MPEHAASWGKGYPGVLASCPSLFFDLNNVGLNPIANETFEYMIV
jgi:hypothetical protein